MRGDEKKFCTATVAIYFSAISLYCFAFYFYRKILAGEIECGFLLIEGNFEVFLYFTLNYNVTIGKISVIDFFGRISNQNIQIAHVFATTAHISTFYWENVLLG